MLKMLHGPSQREVEYKCKYPKTKRKILRKELEGQTVYGEPYDRKLSRTVRERLSDNPSRDRWLVSFFTHF